MNYFLLFSLAICVQVLLDGVAANNEPINLTRLEEIKAVIFSFDKEKLLNYNWNAHNVWWDLERLCIDKNNKYHSYCYLRAYHHLCTSYVSKSGRLMRSEREFFDLYHYHSNPSRMPDPEVWKKSNLLIYFGVTSLESFKTLLQSTPSNFNRYEPGFGKYFDGLSRCMSYCDTSQNTMQGFEVYFHAISNRVFEVVFHKLSALIKSMDSNALSTYLRTVNEISNGIGHSSNGKWLITRVLKYNTLNLLATYDQLKAAKFFATQLKHSMDYLSLKCQTRQENPCSQDLALFELFGLRSVYQVEKLDELKPKVKLTSIEHPKDEEKKLLLLFCHGSSRNNVPRYNIFFQYFDNVISTLYLNHIQFTITSPKVNAVDVVKVWLEKVISSYLTPLCDNSQTQWKICNLKTLNIIFKGTNIDLFKSKLDVSQENTKMNQIMFDFLSKYPKHKTQMQYAKTFFNYLDVHVSTTYMQLIRELIKNNGNSQLKTLANRFFKYISLEFLPRVCIGFEWKMCHLKNFYPLISSKMSIEKEWQGKFNCLHGIHTVDIQRKLEVLIEEKNNIAVISNVQGSANQIASHIDQNHDAVVKSFGGAFSNLGDYFKNKALVEVGSFKRQISLSRETSTQLLAEITAQIQPLVNDLRKLQGIVTAIVALRIVEKIAEIVLKVIELAEVVANNCNPIKALFGGTDFAKAAKLGIELAQLASDLARLVRKMVVMVQLVSEIQEVANGLASKLKGFKKMQDDNARILKTIHDLNLKSAVTAEELNIFVNSFLSIYQSFQVPMTSSDIVSLEASTVGMIDFMCDLVSSDDTIADVGLKVAAEEYCDRLSTKSSELFSRFHEVFGELNAQFEKLGSFARASATLRSAKLLSDYANGLKEHTVSTGPLYVLEYASLSKLFAEDSIQEAALQFCKYHEYKFGVVPHICTVDGTYSASQIQKMRYYAPPSMKTVTIFPRIPTKQAASPDKRIYHFVDLSALARGETIKFILPTWDHEWMKKHQWALPYDTPSIANYVESFELFLPLVRKSGSTGIKYLHVKTTAKSGHIQRLRPQDSTFYSIPKHEYTFEHSIGQANCANHVYNPYHEAAQCLKQGGLSSICVVSEGSPSNHQELFPSLLTEWSFTANYSNSSGYEMVKPEPGMQLELIAKVVLRRAGSSRRKRSAPVHQLVNACCPENKYKHFKSTGGGSECVVCPNGKRNGLNGYTCIQ